MNTALGRMIILPVLDNSTLDYSDRDAHFLDIPTADLITTARKIEQSHGARFRAHVYSNLFDYPLTDSEDKWMTGGLQLSVAEMNSENFTIQSDTYDPEEKNRKQFFEKFVLTGGDKNKITSEAGSEASEVSYSVKDGDCFFVVPTFGYSSGYSTILYDLDLPHSRIDELNLFYRVRTPRQMFLDESHPFYDFPLVGNWFVYGDSSDEAYYTSIHTPRRY